MRHRLVTAQVRTCVAAMMRDLHLAVERGMAACDSCGLRQRILVPDLWVLLMRLAVHPLRTS